MKTKENQDMRQLKKENKTVILKSNERGITLIALVITIIVLLILVAVTITTLTGENGILTRATEAREETRYATVKEAKDLWKLSKLTAKKTGSTEAERSADVIQRLYQEGTITEEERDSLLAGNTITIAGKEIAINDALTLVEMFKQAKNDGCDGTNCQNPEEHLHIGDYVNYQPSNLDASEPVTEADTGYSVTQNYSVDSNIQWRVLGLNENGNGILLTTDVPIQTDDEENPWLVLQGVESYINCESTLDKVCKIYHNTGLATETRSMTIEDINWALGIEVDEEKNEMHKIGSNVPLSGYYGYFGSQYTYTYRDGNYAPENYMIDVYGSDYTRKVPGNPVHGDAYNYAYNIVGTSETNPILYDLLFGGTESTDNYARSYWLASPGVGAGSGIASFGPGYVDDGRVRSDRTLFYSNGYWNADRRAVRPVVSLKSEVTSLQVTKVEEPQESTIWQGYNNSNPVVADGYLPEDEQKKEDGLVMTPSAN